MLTPSTSNKGSFFFSFFVWDYRYRVHSLIGCNNAYPQTREGSICISLIVAVVAYLFLFYLFFFCNKELVSFQGYFLHPDFSW
jgi:hypothetical protein